MAGHAAIRVRGRVPEQPFELVARTVMLAETAAVGVPLITPADDRVSPVGSVPEASDHE